MRRELILQALDQIDEDSEELTEWLHLFSAYKYDEYRGYQVGERFQASLVAWLYQFEKVSERKVALDVVRRRLIFLSSSEINTLIRSTYERFILPSLNQKATEEHNLGKFDYWRVENYQDLIDKERRRYFFCGLSDGARLDIFRRANHGLISNEQCALSHEISRERWKKNYEALKKEQGDNARFQHIFLIDDFTASGFTMFRKEEDNQFDGKLHSFLQKLHEEKAFFEEMIDFDSLQITVLHYVGTQQAAIHLNKTLTDAKSSSDMSHLYSKVHFEFCSKLGEVCCLNREDEPQFFELIEKYYDSKIETAHTEKGGGSKYGFGSCQLPLVVEHNSPNNSFAIFWAESRLDDYQTHPMMPLFRRRSRHQI